ncbi:MAG TPA: endo-1,4-beta-xylanase [Burkholderiaceae bacterium]|nr:endo-1,4-beta-xylanase [Burkholderiaceae bacterium]
MQIRKSIRKGRILAMAAALAFGSFHGFAQVATQGLRDQAGSFLIGYASMSNFLNVPDTSQYQQVASREFNFVTPENAMKWDATEPSQNSFSFGEADKLVSFAHANGMKIHGHTLVWHAQLPGWVANGRWDRTSLTNVMYNHIDKVVGHWSGQIHAWDVVNEAFNEDGTLRPSLFQTVIGNSFIEQSFQRARAADPNARLIYNDYNIETVNSKSTGVYNMIADFKRRGVPIDGVGLQMHLSGGGIDYNSLAQNMQRFAALGVEVYITEMDVGIPSTSQADLQAQANVYSNVLARCKAQPACKGLQVWGVTDKYTWRAGQNPLPFDANYNAKPAYYALQAGFGSSSPSSMPSPTPAPVTVSAIHRMQSYNFPGMYLRHQNFRARIDANVSLVEDMQFRVAAGLAGSDTISFESVNFPGWYLRQRNGEVWLDPKDGSASFNADATWYRRAGLANGGWSSYESYNDPGQFMRHYNFQMIVGPVSNALQQADATFQEE